MYFKQHSLPVKHADSEPKLKTSRGLWDYIKIPPKSRSTWCIGGLPFQDLLIQLCHLSYQYRNATLYWKPARFTFKCPKIKKNYIEKSALHQIIQPEDFHRLKCELHHSSNLIFLWHPDKKTKKIPFTPPQLSRQSCAAFTKRGVSPLSPSHFPQTSVNFYYFISTPIIVTGKSVLQCGWYKEKRWNWEIKRSPGVSK